MQNRRVSSEDHRGMGEPLDERDEYGNGIKVPAKYVVQLFDRNRQKSLQRTYQATQESPIVAFYSINPTETNEKEQNIQFADFAQLQEMAGLTPEMKF